LSSVLGDLGVAEAELDPHDDRAALIRFEALEPGLVAFECLAPYGGLERRGRLVGDTRVELLLRADVRSRRS
jgi:hypothetical protein